VSRSSRVGCVAVLAAFALAPTGVAAAPGEGDVREIILDVRDLDLSVSSLDDSIQQSESSTRVTVTLSADVLFAFDSARLAPAAQTRLAETAATIRRLGPASVRVDGYTDGKGTPSYNLGLSRARATAVEQALRRRLRGTATRLTIRGHGEADPVAPNTKPDGTDNPAGRAKNRRVEVTFPKG